jgi:hypothetical protein
MNRLKESKSYTPFQGQSDQTYNNGKLCSREKSFNLHKKETSLTPEKGSGSDVGGGGGGEESLIPERERRDATSSLLLYFCIVIVMT